MQYSVDYQLAGLSLCNRLTHNDDDASPQTLIFVRLLISFLSARSMCCAVFDEREENDARRQTRDDHRPLLPCVVSRYYT